MYKGHHGSNQYAHLHRDSKKTRSVLSQEYKQLILGDPTQAAYYDGLAIRANNKEPEAKEIGTQKKNFEQKLKAVLDEGFVCHGMSSYLILKYDLPPDPDTTDPPTPITSFCLLLYDA